MLLLNGEKITAKEFCDNFSIDISRIKKNPVFELAKKYIKQDKANAGRLRVPPRITFPARFFFRDKDGNTNELRYAERVSNRSVRGEMSQVYSPINIKFEAVKNSFKKDIDEAVFVFANPENLDSPFRGGVSKDYMYQHVDNLARALSKGEKLNKIGEAMEHVRKLSEEELVILAKGLSASFSRFNPFSEGIDTEIPVLRVNMLEFAQSNPESYLNAVESKTADLKGRIINLVDKKILELKNFNGGSSKQWHWLKGDKSGQPVGDLIYSAKTDAKEYLINYIMNNLESYYEALHTISESISAEAKAIEFLKNKRIVVEEEVSIDGLPKDFHEAKAWLEKHGFKKMPSIAKQLVDGINEGKINNENAIGVVENLFKLERGE